MAKLKIILDTRRALSNDSPNAVRCYPLKLSVFIAGKGRFLINTDISVPQANWENGAIKGLPQKEIYNQVLRARLNSADSEILKLDISGELAKMSLSEIKKCVTDIVRHKSGESQEINKSLIVDYFREFIDRKDREGTKSVYEQTLVKIGRYYDLTALEFGDINLVWLREFERKMRVDGLAVNSISIHFRNLRAVFNSAINEDCIEQNCYPFRKFKIKTERTAKRALTVEQLRTLRDYPCEAHQERFRDIFMLIFYLIGINIGDLLNLKEIKDGRIEFRRAKTGRLYSIKVPREAMLIIEKYRGEEYLLNILDVYGDADNFLSRLNKNLKQIGTVKRVGLGGRKEREPILPMLSTYWARHTWATIAASLDITKRLSRQHSVTRSARPSPQSTSTSTSARLTRRTGKY